VILCFNELVKVGFILQPQTRIALCKQVRSRPRQRNPLETIDLAIGSRTEFGLNLR
jgi:hypothetical protein